MVGEEVLHRSRFATHHLRVSKAFFSALCGAISEISMQTNELYSFRRLLTLVLANPVSPLFRMDRAVLDRLCNPETVNGNVHLTVRIESRYNDVLREFREHAEAELGRPVSVVEAIRVCVHAVTDP